MPKIWSISTTVRNPERVRNFLSTLNKLRGEVWTKDIQAKFQIMLLQDRFYGFGERQFYTDLETEDIELIDSLNPIPYEKAKQILIAKDYEGGLDMRGRQSYKPIEKMGFAYLDENKKIQITSFGDYFLKDDYDLGAVFFRSFLKWQLPNPESRDFTLRDGYNIKPFIATLHLINNVNQFCANAQMTVKGISRIEFALFALTLTHYENIEQQTRELIDFRLDYEQLETKEAKDDYAQNYIINQFDNFENIQHAETYADNVIRYFRLTRYIHIRGNGWYIDLEPRRKIEIDRLLTSDNASIVQFANKSTYIEYLGDKNLPILPWESINDLKNITLNLINEINEYKNNLLTKAIPLPVLNEHEYTNYSAIQLSNYIEELRQYRKSLNELELKYYSQEIENIQIYIEKLKNIFKLPNRPVMLEKFATMAFNALNDAIHIKPNYPVGDDNEPTFTAPGNKPDIECYYSSFNTLCEVTLLTNKTQWFNEGQPVMRHLRDFEDNNIEKPTYCLFVAPSLHRDTINTFWISIKYEYEGRKQKIVPLRINDLILLLEYLIRMKENRITFTHVDLSNLYDIILNKVNEINDSESWVREIPRDIVNWAENKLNGQNAN